MIFSIVFAFAFLGMMLMLLYKAYEQKRNSQTFASRFFAKFDDRIARKLEKGRTLYDRGVDDALGFVTEDIPKQSKEIVGLAKDSALDMYKSVVPNIRGTRILKATRSASAFLRDIKDHREKNGKGRIEDSL